MKAKRFEKNHLLPDGQTTTFKLTHRGRHKNLVAVGGTTRIHDNPVVGGVNEGTRLIVGKGGAINLLGGPARGKKKSSRKNGQGRKIPYLRGTAVAQHERPLTHLTTLRRARRAADSKKERHGKPVWDCR